MRLVSLVISIAVLIGAALWLRPSAADPSQRDTARDVRPVSGEIGRTTTLENVSRVEPRVRTRDDQENVRSNETEEAEGVVLEGRIIDKRGRPQAGLAIVAEHPDPHWREFGVYMRARTGTNGEFRIEGMSPLDSEHETYAIRDDGVKAQELPVIGRVGRDQVSSPITLTYDVDRVVVHWKGPPLDLDMSRVADFEKGRPRVYLADAGPIGEIARARPERIDASGHLPRTDGADVFFRVPSGRQYAVCAFGPTLRSRVKFLALAEGAGRVDVDLAASDGKARGRLRVRIKHDPLLIRPRVLRLRFEDVETGFTYRTEPFEDQFWPRNARLPTGDYRVVAERSPAHSHIGGADIVGLAQAIATVSSGRAADVDIGFPGSGWLEVTVQGSPRSDDILEASSRRASAELTHAPILARVESASGAYVRKYVPTSTSERQDLPSGITIRDVGASPITPRDSRLPKPHDPRSGALPTTLSFVPKFHSIPVGEWVITAELNGGRRVTRQFSVVRGQTTSVHLDFGD